MLTFQEWKLLTPWSLYMKEFQNFMSRSARLLYPLPLAGFPPQRVSFFPINRCGSNYFVDIDCAQWRRGAWISLCATQVCYDRWATAVK